MKIWLVPRQPSEFPSSSAERATPLSPEARTADTPLHAEFHEFVALALLVGCGQVGFRAAIRDGDNICLVQISGGLGILEVECAYGVVNSTLQLSLVSSLTVGWIRIWRIFRLDGAAIRAIKGIEECVEEAGESVVGFVDGIVGLEDNCVLWGNEEIGDFKIEDRLGPCV